MRFPSHKPEVGSLVLGPPVNWSCVSLGKTLDPMLLLVIKPAPCMAAAESVISDVRNKFTELINYQVQQVNFCFEFYLT